MFSSLADGTILSNGIRGKAYRFPLPSDVKRVLGVFVRDTAPLPNATNQNGTSCLVDCNCVVMELADALPHNASAAQKGDVVFTQVGNDLFVFVVADLAKPTTSIWIEYQRTLTQVASDGDALDLPDDAVNLVQAIVINDLYRSQGEVPPKMWQVNLIDYAKCLGCNACLDATDDPSANPSKSADGDCGCGCGGAGGCNDNHSH